jgi:sulfur-carrier protein
MRVNVLFFAMLRDHVGTDERSYELPPDATAASLWKTLASRHPALEAFQTPPMVAVNEAYADPGAALADGDVVAFIPPVSGG